MDATGVEAGTVSARRERIGGSEISEVVFAPGARLSWHHHPRSCLAVVIGGAIRKVFPRLEEDAVDGTVIEMPAAERHEDLLGRDGARIVVIESEVEGQELRCFRSWRATVLAHDVSRELAHPDAFTQLALEGLALELAATVARGREAVHHEPRLDLVRAMLEDRLTHPPSLGEIASEVGLHPSHLARTFRAHVGRASGSTADACASNGQPSGSSARTKGSPRSRGKRASPTRVTSRASSSGGSGSRPAATDSRTVDPTGGRRVQDSRFASP